MPPTTMMVPMEEAAASPYSASLSTCTNVSGLSERTKQELNALKTQLKKAEDKYEKTLLNVHFKKQKRAVEDANDRAANEYEMKRKELLIRAEKLLDGTEDALTKGNYKGLTFHERYSKYENVAKKIADVIDFLSKLPSGSDLDKMLYKFEKLDAALGSEGYYDVEMIEDSLITIERQTKLRQEDTTYQSFSKAAKKYRNACSAAYSQFAFGVKYVIDAFALNPESCHSNTTYRVYGESDDSSIDTEIVPAPMPAPAFNTGVQRKPSQKKTRKRLPGPRPVAAAASSGKNNSPKSSAKSMSSSHRSQKSSAKPAAASSGKQNTPKSSVKSMSSPGSQSSSNSSIDSSSSSGSPSSSSSSSSSSGSQSSPISSTNTRNRKFTRRKTKNP
jgi:hypothetical protein